MSVCIQRVFLWLSFITGNFKRGNKGRWQRCILTYAIALFYNVRLQLSHYVHIFPTTMILCGLAAKAHFLYKMAVQVSGLNRGVNLQPKDPLLKGFPRLSSLSSLLLLAVSPFFSCEHVDHSCCRPLRWAHTLLHFAFSIFLDFISQHSFQRNISTRAFISGIKWIFKLYSTGWV